jgi:NAD(P)-dependent dehydrogenase (short-subunit alcohol dehydrogenase family)
MVCRSKDRGEQVRAEIISRSKNEAIDLFVADLSDMEQIRRVARELLAAVDPIHVLIHNAGLSKRRRELTADGLETTFAVNHLAPFLLTHLLLDRIKASAPARILTVTSGLHHRGVVDFDNLQGERKHDRSAYVNSKLMNILFSYKLARELEGTGVTSNTVHPGFIATRLGRESPVGGWIMRRVAAPIEEGSRSTIFAALDPSLDTATGKFIDRHSKIAESAPQSYDEAVQERLWEVSLQLAGIETY